MKRSILIAALVFIGLGLTSPNAAAQVNGRIIRLTVLFDYARGAVEVDGTVTTPDGIRPDLSVWGFAETLPSWQDADHNWNVHGSIGNAQIVAADENGVYHLQIKPLTLAPGDQLTLKIPFVNLDYARIDSPPDNLQLLTSPNLPPDLLPSLLGLQYSGASGRTINLDIPFTIVRKQITLQATPLVGEMLLGRTDSFRISGHVVFDGLTDYGEFNRHCANDPASRVQYRYRVADLLFALDGLPIYNSGLLSNAYQFKTNYLLTSVDLASCQFDTKRGRVEANFSGRAFAVANASSPLPPTWMPADKADANQSATGLGENAYELRFGNVVLAPGDVLTVTVPATEIHNVQPPPTRYLFSRDGTPEIAYEGPARFTLRITYVPQPELFLHQIPATARALLQSVEVALRPLLDPPGAPLTWALLMVGLVFLAARRFAPGRAALVIGGIGWALAALALYFGLRGAFGLLTLAVLVYVDSLNDRKNFAAGLTRAAFALALILAAMYIDHQSESIFTLLTTLQLESTPVTPVIFLLLGVALAAVMAFPRAQICSLFPRVNNAVVLVLIAFAAFDVLQKSLLGLAIIGLGMLYLARRTAHTGDRMHGTEIVYRVKSIWKSRFVPLGIVVMILFAAQSGLQSTTAVLGSSLGLLGSVLMPILLLISIVQGFLATGALFIMVYPVLPFKAGYLKALSLALFLLALFMVGTGADDRLVSTFESLIVGRLVYYVSVPLLIGLYFDIVQFMRAEDERQTAEGKSAAPLTIEQAAPMYFKRVQGLIGTVGALASLVAPGAYALFAGTPLVTTYFDILGKLAAVSLGA